MISSKSLPLSFQLTPIKEVENEEILQGDSEIADQPVVWLPNYLFGLTSYIPQNSF